MNREEIRARAEAATPGPWTHGTYRTVLAGMTTFTGNHAADAGFVRHAREDIPNLLALVDALTAENARLRRELDANEGAEDARLAVAEAREEKLTTTLDAVRRLCQSYTPEPPPLFRNPTSQHGEGYNHGTRDMAEAILGVLDGEEESS